MKYNIDFDQWGELKPKWHNMEFVENKTVEYYEKKYPIGTKVRIKKDSVYYNRNTRDNPKHVIGYIYGYKEYSGYFDKYYYFIYVVWDNKGYNSYRIIDLEYYKE
jgi:hypothetical protein